MLREKKKRNKSIEAWKALAKELRRYTLFSFHLEGRLVSTRQSKGDFWSAWLKWDVGLRNFVNHGVESPAFAVAMYWIEVLMHSIHRKFILETNPFHHPAGHKAAVLIATLLEPETLFSCVTGGQDQFPTQTGKASVLEVEFNTCTKIYCSFSLK